jgi:hypothetical protein
MVVCGGGGVCVRARVHIQLKELEAALEAAMRDLDGARAQFYLVRVSAVAAAAAVADWLAQRLDDAISSCCLGMAYALISTVIKPRGTSTAST